MTGQQSTIEAINETVKNHNGFNYVEYVATYNTYSKTYYGCNCSHFNTEAEVINFINEIA